MDKIDIFIEELAQAESNSVGVGQSETAVHSMVDFFLSQTLL